MVVGARQLWRRGKAVRKDLRDPIAVPLLLLIGGGLLGGISVVGLGATFYKLWQHPDIRGRKKLPWVREDEYPSVVALKNRYEPNFLTEDELEHLDRPGSPIPRGADMPSQDLEAQADRYILGGKYRSRFLDFLDRNVEAYLGHKPVHDGDALVQEYEEELEKEHGKG